MKMTIIDKNGTPLIEIKKLAQLRPFQRNLKYGIEAYHYYETEDKIDYPCVVLISNFIAQGGLFSDPRAMASGIEYKLKLMRTAFLNGRDKYYL